MFSFVSDHCIPVFHIPKTDSADSFRKSFLALPASFDFSAHDLQDKDEIHHVLAKTVKFVNDIYTVAQDYNASEVGA